MEDVRLNEVEAPSAAKAGNFEKAIKIWKQILEAYPRWENGFAHYNLADCYACSGKFDLAIDTYHQAIALSPNDPMFTGALESLLGARKSGYI